MSDLDTIFGEMMDVIIDQDKENYHNDLEPFEVYKERTKVKGVKVFNDYINSVQHGYDVILQKIKTETK